MADYTRGDSKQIIVGAAALFVSTGSEFDPTTGGTDFPNFASGEKYQKTLTNWDGARNIGFTSNGLEIQFQPNFGEVNVDQLLDVAKLYKQGMKVDLKTSFAEATLENLLIAIAAPASDYSTSKLIDPLTANASGATATSLNLSSGNIGECPVERGLVAVGPGTGDCDPGNYIERVYIAYRALSIDNVTVNAKRDAASMFDVSFRLLPNGATGSYGKIIDRTVSTGS